MNPRLTFLLTALMIGSASSPAQTHAATHPTSSGLLMQEPLGDTNEPKMSLFILNLPAGVSVPMHQHAGVVFAYILEGDIENQVEPDSPQTYHPGNFFYEPPMHLHRIFRNLSMTKPAQILVFQNTGTLPPSLKPLLQEPLADVANQQVSMIRLVPPSVAAPVAHQHPGPVFGYIVKGEIESQVDPEQAKAYHAGDAFYEPPLHAHRLFRNLSKTDPAEVVVFEVSEKGQRLAMPVKE